MFLIIKYYKNKILNIIHKYKNIYYEIFSKKIKLNVIEIRILIFINS